LIFTKKNTIVVVDDFFSDISEVNRELDDVEQWSVVDHPDKNMGAWPGYRSTNLVLLNHSIVRQFKMCAYDYLGGLTDMMLYKHTRLSSDEQRDYIHSDGGDIAGLVYLSPTNLDSSTRFYDKADMIAEVKFVQNRAVFFTAAMPHRAFGNHGEDLQSGRTTLNLFARYM
jgi:hypothetical protein